MSDFSGRWHASFGPMVLRQTGDQVEGHYTAMGIDCPLNGQVEGRRLTFTYQEPNAHGEGWFDLAPGERAFSGQWRADGNPNWQPWTGTRFGFDGVWLTDFGHMRLVEGDNGVHGLYEGFGGSTVEGQLADGALAFTYREPNAGGEGRFVLAEDGLSFTGQWRPDGSPHWGRWSGRRLLPTNLQWLVVLEVPWHTIAADRDYSFGGMLRAFFERMPGVRMRHRFFRNEASLQRLCRELWYIPEPVVLLVATHSMESGIPLDGATVVPDTFAESLHFVPDLRLLHFSACLLMKDPAMLQRWQTLAAQLGTAVSGYSTSVNWASSAILEFTYLELIFGQNMVPAQAADQLGKLLTFAGDDAPAGGVFAGAGFRMVTP